MPPRERPLAPLNGAKWRATHQRTIDSILGVGVRKVYSRGAMFYNVDHWPARVFASHFCEWGRLNRGARPTREDVMDWLRKANDGRMPESQKHIVIAATPDELPAGLARALVGGGYHEAWHTLYSLRRDISIREVWPKLLNYWDRAPWDPAKKKFGWASLMNAVLHWSNIIEDIRIERMGCREFPGAPASMEALQDLILKMESEGETANEHRKVAEGSEKLTVLAGAFRDLGLGYQTNLQLLTLERYRERSPEAWEMVTNGSLREFLDRAISLGSEDGMESLWLAMEIVIRIIDLATPEEEKGEGSGKSGSGSKPAETDQQAEASGQYGEDPDDIPEDQKATSRSKKPVLFKVGDRAKIKAGANAGSEVEVVRASVPHPATGIQELEWALVTP